MSRKNQLPKNIYHASLEEEAIYFKNIVLSNNERKALLELTALKIQGNIKYENIVNTIIGVMKKTPIARCSFQILNDTLIKKDNLNIALNNLISFYDLSDLSEKKQDEKYNNILNKTFDISKKVVDFACLKYHSRKHVLIVRAHHIASDHVTSMKFLHDFFDTYNEILIKGERCKITKYSNEEVNCSLVRKESALNDTEPTKYWKNVFRKTLYLSEFKPDLPYPEEGSGNGGLVNFKIGETSLLKKHSKKNRITPFIFLLGVLNTFMYQRNKAKHCCLSIALSTRDKSTKNISGCFINSLPLIVEPNENESFKCFLKKIKSEIKNLQKYKQYPFSEVNKLFSNIGKLPYHPLQRVFTTYTYTGKLEKVIENVKLSYLPIRSFGTNGSDMSIVFIDDGKCIHADLNYNKDIFHKDTINNFIEGFKTVLNHVLDDDTKKLKNINIVSEKEKHWLLDECNNTKKDYPREKTIHRVFEEKVKNTPNAIAVVYKDKEITYKELNEEANKLANYLIQQGVEVEDLIGICVDRSIEMVVGLLAVLKAGAAYVPIDPTYPKDRINYMIKDSKASFILTQMHLKEFLVNVKSAIIFLDRINLKDFSIKNPKVNMSSRNLAYVIFTSGSTGKPKGVMVEHRSVLNLVLNQKYINLKCPKIMQLSTISFDASIFEIYYTLLNNGSLILYPHADIEFRILLGFNPIF
ncbi:MAG: AMP-binding protein [Gammaproteobacteria bacterium]|nr:AMP-binding protein [Gammaproteobacteria bacterium]